jgi:eukaryotic-like serine/threonine-protein kinase
VPPPDPDSSPGAPTLGSTRPQAVPDSKTLDQSLPDEKHQPSATADDAAGRYRILRLRARGGLGEVFIAHDDELGRDVALKRLRPGRADDPDSRRRFVTEAAVTARLEHPGVVPVHGLVQDAAGRPAYAMRFIQGDTLADAIERFHGTATAADAKKSASEIIIDAFTGPPAPRFDSLEFRQMLTRFVAVCNAIAFAHSRGIIHRDLKPANVMLGPYGETLVVDWGLAKDTQSGGPQAPGSSFSSFGDFLLASSEDSSLPGGNSETQAGVILGTPSYMAPEQADGRAVSPVADVFGLGGILYAMLTGGAPVRGKNTLETLDRARRGDVPPPRAMIPAVPRSLDAVCRKAMAFDPPARYRSALDLAADVERWLADEPVSAERESTRDWFRRWSRRHRTAVAAGFALLATAVVGLTVATTLISRQEQMTAAAKKRAEEQRDRADQNLRLAARAVDAAKNRVSGNPRLMAGDFHELRIELLAALIPFYEELARRTGDDPAVETQSGLAYGFLGNLRREMGQTDQAERDFHEYLTIFTRLAASDPNDPGLRRRLASGHNDLGNLLGDLGKYPEARIELGEAVKLEREFVAANPTDAESRRSLATGLNGLANVMDDGKPQDAAEPVYREALELARGLVAEDAADPARITLCAGIENNLAVFLRRKRRPTEAEPLYRSVIDRRTKLANADPKDRINRRELVAARFNLALLLHTTGRLPAAEAEYRADIALAEKLAADFAGVPTYQALLGKPLANLADLLGNTGRAKESVEVGRRAVAVFDRLAADFPGNAEYFRGGGDSWFNVGTAAQNLNQVKEAEAAYRRAADYYAQLAAVAPNDSKPTADLAVTWVTLGKLAQANGNAPVALEWFNKAIARLAGARGDFALQEAHAGRAGVLIAQEKFPEAVAAWNAAIAVADATAQPELRLQRARTLNLAGDYRKAADEARNLAAATNSSAEILDGSARLLSLAAAKTNGAEANQYAAEAVALLRRACAAGRYREPDSADKLRGDADFASLRERDDFRTFLAEVGK